MTKAKPKQPQSAICDSCIKLGDTIELDINDLGSNGEGIGHYENYTVFLPQALPKERVLARVEHIKKSLIFASLIKTITSSAQRVRPICPLFGRCGGCDIMHLEYSAQLDYKQSTLINILKKNANYTGEVDKVAPSKPLYYRNKIQLPFGIQSGKVVLGFFKAGTHNVVPLTKCYLHADWADKLIGMVLGFANSTAQTVYNEKSGKGLLRHLTARYIDNKLSVTLVINGDGVDGIELLSNQLQRTFPSVTLSLSVNKKQNNIVMGDKLIEVLKGEQTLSIGGVALALNPLSFFQVNDEIRDKIYTQIIEIIQPNPNTIFIDCYAGVGLLGALLAKSGVQTYNIEIIPEAVQDANALYAKNNLTATNINGDAAEALPKLLASENLYLDGKQIIIFLDPPRKGLSPELTATLNTLPLHKDLTLIYLSCNPKTLSRDIAALSSYHPTAITPYDMFPQTKHVETVVLMTRL
ncbi:MAG: 23S rRNA (uracil(1939)-C(5))-methyltransferase RlmD [Clostridia bacterium]